MPRKLRSIRNEQVRQSDTFGYGSYLYVRFRVYPVSNQVTREAHEILDEVARQNQLDTSNVRYAQGLSDPQDTPRDIIAVVPAKS